MGKLLLFMNFILLSFSCSNKSNSDIPVHENIEEDIDKAFLVSFNSKFIMNDGANADGYYQNRKSFIKPFISCDFRNDTLYASTLYEVNTCGKTIGDIKISNDTLYLFVKQIGSEACTSVEFRKYNYVIVGKNISSYFIAF